jgi:hypothetical protein
MPSQKINAKASCGGGSVAPRLYLMKGESGNLQFPLSTTISFSITLRILNLVVE